MSKNNKTYYETRANRSDIKQSGKRGELLGIGSIFDTDLLMDLDALKTIFQTCKKISSGRWR